jgi:hypothetical protein
LLSFIDNIIDHRYHIRKSMPRHTLHFDTAHFGLCEPARPFRVKLGAGSSWFTEAEVRSIEVQRVPWHTLSDVVAMVNNIIDERKQVRICSAGGGLDSEAKRQRTK